MAYHTFACVLDFLHCRTHWIGCNQWSAHGLSHRRGGLVPQVSKVSQLKAAQKWLNWKIYLVFFSLNIREKNDLSFDWLDLFCILKFYDVFLRYLLSEKETRICIIAWRHIQQLIILGRFSNKTLYAWSLQEKFCYPSSLHLSPL